MNHQLIRQAIARLEGWHIAVEDGHRWLCHGADRYIAEKGLIAHGYNLDGKLIVIKCDEEAWEWAMANNLIPDYPGSLEAILAALHRLGYAYKIEYRPELDCIGIAVDGRLMGMASLPDLPGLLSHYAALHDEAYACLHRPH